MNRKISLSVFIFVIVATVIVTFLSSFAVLTMVFRVDLIDAIRKAQNSNDGTFAEELDLIDALFRKYMYFDMDDEELKEAVIRSYVDATGDDYAWYFDAEEFQQLIADNQGSGSGIGIRVQYAEGYEGLHIYQVILGSPAYDAGLKAGDIIIYVGSGEDKKSVVELGYDEAVSRLRGEAGTKAEFTVRRGKDSAEIIEFSIERSANFDLISVLYKVSETDPTVGIVQVLEFDGKTPQQFAKAIDTLLAQGVKKFVFDMRDNPGGTLQSVCAISSYFLNDGDKIISVEDKYGNGEVYTASNSYSGGLGKYRDLDCVVLVNGKTASAAEVFTAVLRDYELAEVVGVTTFGKGIMQQTYDLSYYGYDGAVKMTTHMYFPPSGESYHGIGITPDIYVELSDEAIAYDILNDHPEHVDNQLIAAINALNK